MFNKEFIKKNFYFLDEKLIYFNHGIFGICPRPVMEEKFNILRKFEANPVIGFSETMFDGCLENTKIAAERFGMPYNNFAIIENVTSGFHTILQSIELKGDEEILITNVTYPVVKMTVEDIIGKKGFTIRTLQLHSTFKSNQEIVNLYKSFVLEHPQIKYAIVDHISSGLPFVQPVNEITKTLKEIGVFVIIDGAHAPGQIKDLNIKKICADIYIGNLHKWCFLPRGTGFLALGDNVNINIRPPIISYLHHKELFLRFIFMGTNDISNILCIKAAFEFLDMLGGMETIHNAITETLEKGIKYLEDQWNVSVIRFPEMAPFMRLIPLPEGFTKFKDVIMKLIEIPYQRDFYSFTYNNFNFETAIFLINNKLHFRICCHIYNNFDHFVQFSQKVIDWQQFLDKGGVIVSKNE